VPVTKVKNRKDHEIMKGMSRSYRREEKGITDQKKNGKDEYKESMGGTRQYTYVFTTQKPSTIHTTAFVGDIFLCFTYERPCSHRSSKEGKRRMGGLATSNTGF